MSESDLAAEAEREQMEEKRRFYQKILQHAAASNRRADEELHRLVVEERIAAFSRLLHGSKSSSSVQTGGGSNTEIDISIDLDDESVGVIKSPPATAILNCENGGVVRGNWFARMWTALQVMMVTMAQQNNNNSAEQGGIDALKDGPESEGAQILGVGIGAEDGDDMVDMDGDDGEPEYSDPVSPLLEAADVILCRQNSENAHSSDILLALASQSQTPDPTATAGAEGNNSPSGGNKSFQQQLDESRKVVPESAVIDSIRSKIISNLMQSLSGR